PCTGRWSRVTRLAKPPRPTRRPRPLAVGKCERPFVLHLPIGRRRPGRSHGVAGLELPPLQTAALALLVFTGQATVYSVRERGHPWSSRPGAGASPTGSRRPHFSPGVRVTVADIPGRNLPSRLERSISARRVPF